MQVPVTESQVNQFEGLIVKEKNNQIQQRVSKKLCEDISEVERSWLIRGIDKKKSTMPKITNMLTRHKLWKVILNDLKNASKEEIEKYA